MPTIFRSPLEDAGWYKKHLEALERKLTREKIWREAMQISANEIEVNGVKYVRADKVSDPAIKASDFKIETSWSGRVVLKYNGWNLLVFNKDGTVCRVSGIYGPSFPFETEHTKLKVT